MRNRINAFLNFINTNPIELFSEAGLQHEFALFLRHNYPELTVRLEYPTTRMGFNGNEEFIKKEIDIYLTHKDGERYIVELKMPKFDCGIPAEMYSAIKDVKFLEQLKHNNIDQCFAILFTNHQAFWNAPRANAGIYRFFNGVGINIQTIEEIHLPNFLHIHGAINIVHNYQTNWENYTDIDNRNWRYYVLEI